MTSIAIYKQIQATIGAPPHSRLIDLYLSQNGLKDHTACVLLQAVGNCRQLKRFTYKQNELGPHTAQQIGRMLLWPHPYHLEHLTL